MKAKKAQAIKGNINEKGDDSRPSVTCDCASWGAPCPHLLWPENDSGEDAIHAAAAAVAAIHLSEARRTTVD